MVTQYVLRLCTPRDYHATITFQALGFCIYIYTYMQIYTAGRTSLAKRLVYAELVLRVGCTDYSSIIHQGSTEFYLHYTSLAGPAPRHHQPQPSVWQRSIHVPGIHDVQLRLSHVPRLLSPQRWPSAPRCMRPRQLTRASTTEQASRLLPWTLR